MNLTYKQAFVQQKNLQQTLYGKFGYKIEPMNQVVEKKKKNDQYPVTANIKLRKVAPSLYKNERIDQVEKEIDDIRKDRKRREEQSKATKTPEDSDKYINKMNHIIDQYNYLIDHKHIKEKGTDEARKMLNIKPKTQAQKAMEQIQALKDELMHANIQQQFKLNRKINDLYRLFKNKIDQPPQHLHRKKAVSEHVKDIDKTQSFRVMSQMYQESHRASSIASRFDHHKKNDKGQQNLSMGHTSLHQIKTDNQKSENYLNASFNEGKLRKIKSFDGDDVVSYKQSPLDIIEETNFMRRSPQKGNKNSQKQKRQQEELQQSILEPYVRNSFIQSGIKMDVKIKNNIQALQLWKGRIAQAVPVHKQPNTVSRKSIRAENRKRERELQKIYDKINDEQLALKEHIPFIQNKKVYKHETIESLKMKNMEQESILSGLLEKRHCKYLRPWGTKILVKYDASKQAKQMLGLSPTKQPKQGQKNQTNSQTEFTQKKQIEKGNLQLSLPFKQNDQNLGLDWNKQIDEEYYWTMCKNEKINLLLKGKRR